jgi:hypothetical protein
MIYFLKRKEKNQQCNILVDFWCFFQGYLELPLSISNVSNKKILFYLHEEII